MSELYIFEKVAEEPTKVVDSHARAAFQCARVPFANLFNAQETKPLRMNLALCLCCSLSTRRAAQLEIRGEE